MICGGNASRIKIFKLMSKTEIIEKLGCLKNGEIDIDLLEKALEKEKDDVKKYVRARIGA